MAEELVVPFNPDVIRAARTAAVKRAFYVDDQYQVIRDPQDKRLHVKSKRIKNVQDPKIIELTKQLVARHLIEGGLGLAAPQIGVNLRMAVVQPPGWDRPMVVYNPVIVNVEALLPNEGGTNMEWDAEGCLSHPGVIPEVARVREFEFYASTYSRPHPKRYKAEGMLARILQHEIDHLNGILMTDRPFIRNVQIDRAGQEILRTAAQENKEHGYADPGID